MCGFKLDNNESYNQEQDDSPIIGEQYKNTSCINSNKMNGGSGKVKLKLFDLVVNVLKKHTLEEREYTFIVLGALLRVFENILVYPGIIFIGALIVSLSLLIFFWEVNAARNINIFDVDNKSIF